MKRKIAIDLEGRENFHNVGPINIIVDTNIGVPGWGRIDGARLLQISKHQERKLRNWFCGMPTCQCGCNGGVVEYDHHCYGIYVEC